jgi:MerR family transcriptional regulator, light-induced transcriptional regulator
MARVFDAALPATSRLNPLLVAACADVERHEIGLRMICDLLELKGWDTVYLGAAVPVESLVEMVRRRAPDVVALSTSLHAHLPRLEAMVRAVRESAGERSPLVMVGGRPFLEEPDLVARIGADLTAPSAREAVEALMERVPG